MRRRSGMVLLMTIGLVALAATAMVRLANRSLSVVARGTIAQRELQQRWSSASCRLAILERADELFQQRDAELLEVGAGWPLANEIHLAFKLNDEPFQIVLRDEQARANVNIIGRKHPQKLFSAIAQMAVATSAPVHLRPLPVDDTSNAPRFLSWGQIVDLTRVDRARSIADIIMPITRIFTCWGDGHINICRADDDAIRLVVADILNAVEVEELLQRRHGHKGTVDELWTALDVHRQKQLRLNQVVDDDSRCFSLLVLRPAANREVATLIVHDAADRSNSPQKVFHW